MSIQFEYCRWELHESDNIFTVFWDGLLCEASPVPERDIPTAQRYGYGDDTRSLWLHHDLLHTRLMTLLGHPYSPTLRYVATNGQEPAFATYEYRCAEESFVLDWALYCNGGPEPWINPILMELHNT